ncbi:unnamed protein product, partial [Amoebophrya sp. A25]
QPRGAGNPAERLRRAVQAKIFEFQKDQKKVRVRQPDPPAQLQKQEGKARSSSAEACTTGTTHLPPRHPPRECPLPPPPKYEAGQDAVRGDATFLGDEPQTPRLHEGLSAKTSEEHILGLGAGQGWARSS